MGTDSSHQIDWLPAGLEYSDYGGDWDRYLEDIYSIFKQGFIDDATIFQRKRVVLSNSTPYPDGKHATFWHLISDRSGVEEVPDMERCRKSCWIKAILEQCPHDEIYIWHDLENKKKEKRVYVWCKKAKYLIILKELRRCFILITAYDVRYSNTERKYQKAYDKFIKHQQKAGAAQ